MVLTGSCPDGLTVYVNFYSRRYVLPGVNDTVWQYMLISTLVDHSAAHILQAVWQYMLISTLVDEILYFLNEESDSIC